MIKLKRFDEVNKEEKVNEASELAIVSSLAAAFAGLSITSAVIYDVAKLMKEKNYTGIKGFLKALKEWRASKKGDDVASKF